MSKVKQKTPHRIVHDALMGSPYEDAWPLFMRNVWRDDSVIELAMLKFCRASNIIYVAFRWDATPEGRSYWEEVSCLLGDLKL